MIEIVKVARVGTIWTCSTCGGTNVQTTAWIDPNTDRVVDCEGPLDDNWCEDCQEHVGLDWVMVIGSGAFARVAPEEVDDG